MAEKKCKYFFTACIIDPNTSLPQVVAMATRINSIENDVMHIGKCDLSVAITGKIETCSKQWWILI